MLLNQCNSSSITNSGNIQSSSLNIIGASGLSIGNGSTVNSFINQTGDISSVSLLVNNASLSAIPLTIKIIYHQILS